MNRGSGTLSPNLQLIQQKAAKLLLGLNNNNSLFEMSNHSSNLKSPLNITQKYGSPFQKQNQHKKNQDIIDAFDDSRFSQIKKKSVMHNVVEINQTNMFNIKSKNTMLDGPGSRYGSKNTTSNDGFFPMTTKSVGFKNNLNNQVIFNKTQTAQISARSQNRRRAGAERVGITGFNLQNNSKKKQSLRPQLPKFQNTSFDMSVGIQQMSRSFVQNEDLKSFGDAPRRIRKRYHQTASVSTQKSQINKSHQACPPINHPMSPMNHQFQGNKLGVMSLNSENVLQNWQQSELPQFIGARGSSNTYKVQQPNHCGTASRFGRNKLQPEQSKRNVFSAEPHVNASGEQTLENSPRQTKMARGNINLKPIDQSSAYVSQTTRQQMSHKFTYSGSAGGQFSTTTSKLASVLRNQQHGLDTPFDSVQYLSSPQNSSRNPTNPSASRNPAQIRRYMQKFDDLTQEPVLQNVFIKLWKMLLKTQYKREFERSNPDSKLNLYQNTKTKLGKQVQKIKQVTKDIEILNDPVKKISFQSNIATIPLDLQVYNQCIPQFKKALGAMFDTDEFVAKSPQYINSHVFFDRFCYDMVSLLGDNVYKLNLLDIEYIFRTTYLTLSHSFGPQEGGVKLLQLNSIIVSPFSAEALQELNQRMVFESDTEIHKIRVSSPTRKPGSKDSSTVESKKHSKVPSAARSPKSPKIRIQSKNLPEWSAKKERGPKGFYHGAGEEPSRKTSPSLQRPSALKKFGKDERKPALKSPGDAAFGAVSERRGSFYLQEDLESNNDLPIESAKKQRRTSKQKTKRKANTRATVNQEQHTANHIPHSSNESRFRATDYRDQVAPSSLGLESPEARSVHRTPDASPPLYSAGRESVQGTELAESVQTGLKSNLSLAQLMAQKAKEKADKATAKLSKLAAIQEREQTAVSFQPADVETAQQSQLASQVISEEDGTISEGGPFKGPSLEQKEADYRKLQQLKSKRRGNLDASRNGSIRPTIRATDESVYQDGQTGDSTEGQRGQLQEKRIIAGHRKRAPPASKIGREQQLDILEGFRNYDESMFKTGMNDSVLNEGLQAQNLLPTEINLLQSNRIDRKTILLNHMQMFDRASCGVPNTDALHEKQRQLVRKLGYEHVNSLASNSTSERFDQAQPSLDQYDQLNQTSQAGSTTGLVQIQKTNQGVETTNSFDQHLPTHHSGESRISGTSSNDRGTNFQGVQVTSDPRQKKTRCNIEHIMRDSEQVNSGFSGSNAFSQQYDRQPRMPHQVWDSDPMTINPLTQTTSSQADIYYSSVEKTPEEQYVLIDEQGNIRQSPREKDANLKKVTLTGKGLPSRTKYIMQLDPGAKSKMRDHGTVTQISTGEYDPAQHDYQGFQPSKIPTLKMSDNNTSHINQVDREFAPKGLQNHGKLPTLPIKSVSQSAQFSQNQMVHALQTSKRASSRDVLLMEESQGGGDIADNESTNEDQANRRNQDSNSSRHRRNMEVDENIRIKGPTMISIEYDRQDGGNFVQTSINEIGTITTQPAQSSSRNYLDNGDAMYSFAKPVKPVVMSQNKTNFTLMHKKNKQFKKNALLKAQNKPAISQRKLESLMNNRSNEGTSSKEEIKVRSPEDSQRAVHQLQYRAFQELYPDKVLISNQFKQMPTLNSVAILPNSLANNLQNQYASVGVQNTNQLINSDAEQSEEDFNRVNETILRKTTTQNDKIGDRLQTITAAASAKPLFRLASRELTSQEYDAFEIAKTDTFNAVQTLDKKTTQMSFENQISSKKQHESKLKQDHPKELDEKNETFLKNANQKMLLTSYYQHLQLPANMSPLSNSQNKPSISPNTTQISFDNGLMFQQHAVNKDFKFRLAQKEKELRVRRKSPRLQQAYGSKENIQQLSFGIQHRKLNINVDRKNAGSPKKLTPRMKEAVQNTSDAMFQENFGAYGVTKSKRLSPMGKNKAERQVIIPIAQAPLGTGTSLGETPFMRNYNQNSVGNSINSGTSINEEESKSSYQMNTAQSISQHNKMRYQIIHKQSSTQRPAEFKNNEVMLQSIQTSKLLHSSIITGQMGDFNQDHSPSVIDDARNTALISDEHTDEATPQDKNPLLILARDSSSQKSIKVLGNEVIQQQSEQRDITSGSRYIVESNIPTEPNEQIQKQMLDKNIKGVLISHPNAGYEKVKQSPGARMVIQNPSSENNTPAILNVLQSKKVRGPLNFKNIGNQDLDQVNQSQSNKHAHRYSQVHHKNNHKSVRNSSFISSQNIKNSEFVSQTNRAQQSFKNVQKNVDEILNVRENSNSPKGKTHTHLKIKELKIMSPMIESNLEGVLSTPGMKGLKLTDTPSQKFKKAQIKALNLDQMTKQMEQSKEPVLILHGQSPKMLKTPTTQPQLPYTNNSSKSKNEARSRTHVVEVNFQKSQLKKDESELVEVMQTDHDVMIRNSETNNQSPRIGRHVIKSFDSKKDFNKTQSPIERFSGTHSDANPSFSIFGAGQVPQSRQKQSQRSLRSSENYYKSYNDYMQQLNDLQDSNLNRTSPNFFVKPNYNQSNQQTQRSDLQPISARSLKKQNLAGGIHHTNCTRICCIQNAISNQVKLAQKKENIKRMKEDSFQHGIQSLDGMASLGALKKGPITEIAVLSFSDHNLQSWRHIEKSKR